MWNKGSGWWVRRALWFLSVPSWSQFAVQMFPTPANSSESLRQGWAAWQHRCVLEELGRGLGLEQETTSLLLSKQKKKKIAPFVCSRRMHLKWQAKENENKPLPLEAFDGEENRHWRRTYGKTHLQYFLSFLLLYRQCKLDCVLRSPLIMGCLRTVQPFCDLTALWPVGNVETEITRVIQVSGKCLWGVMGFFLFFSFFSLFLQILQHERDQKKKRWLCEIEL